LRRTPGAGFVVAVCGVIMLMPGLPKNPAAETIDIDPAGNSSGLCQWMLWCPSTRTVGDDGSPGAGPSAQIIVHEHEIHG